MIDPWFGLRVPPGSGDDRLQSTTTGSAIPIESVIVTSHSLASTAKAHSSLTLASLRQAVDNPFARVAYSLLTSMSHDDPGDKSSHPKWLGILMDHLSGFFVQTLRRYDGQPRPDGEHHTSLVVAQRWRVQQHELLQKWQLHERQMHDQLLSRLKEGRRSTAGELSLSSPITPVSSPYVTNTPPWLHSTVPSFALPGPRQPLFAEAMSVTHSCGVGNAVDPIVATIRPSPRCALPTASLPLQSASGSAPSQVVNPSTLTSSPFSQPLPTPTVSTGFYPHVLVHSYGQQANLDEYAFASSHKSSVNATVPLHSPSPHLISTRSASFALPPHLVPSLTQQLSRLATSQDSHHTPVVTLPFPLAPHSNYQQQQQQPRHFLQQLAPPRNQLQQRQPQPPPSHTLQNAMMHPSPPSAQTQERPKPHPSLLAQSDTLRKQLELVRLSPTGMDPDQHHSAMPVPIVLDTADDVLTSALQDLRAGLSVVLEQMELSRCAVCLLSKFVRKVLEHGIFLASNLTCSVHCYYSFHFTDRRSSELFLDTRRPSTYHCRRQQWSVSRYPR
jgi:hypothetical protein